MSNNCKIICSRFNEDIQWIKPFIENSIIYNKGESNLEYIPKDKIIPCANVGREGGTYLKYIIDNYPNFPEHMIFLQGKPFDHIFVSDKPKSIKEISTYLKKVDKPNFLYLSKHLIKMKRNEINSYSSGIPSLHNDFFKCKSSIKMLVEKIKQIKQIDFNSNELESLKKHLEDMEKSTNHTKDTNAKEFYIYIYDFIDLLKKDSYFFENKKGEKQRDELLTCFNDPVMNEIVKYGYEFGYGAQFMIHKNQIVKFPLSFWEKLSIGFDVISPSAGWGLEKMWNLILNDYYFRVEWIINVAKLSCPPFQYIWKNNIFFLKSSQNVLYFAKSPNKKLVNLKKAYQNLYIFLLNKPLKKMLDLNLRVGYFKNTLDTFMKFHDASKIGLVYINYSKYIHVFNILQTILSKTNHFILVLENFINFPEFYMDNLPLAYIYNFKKKYNIEIVGVFDKCAIIRFS